MEITKRALSEVYKELKERAKEAGLNIIVRKTTEFVPNRKTRKKKLKIGSYTYDIEVVGSFRYLGVKSLMLMMKWKNSKLEF